MASSNILFITTSHPQASVGLLSAQGFLYQEIHPPQAHSDLLLPKIQELLGRSQITPQDLTLVVYDQGPGSFTGIRLATGFTRALCYALNIPALPVSSFEAHIPSDVKNHHNILVALNAYRESIYLTTPHSCEEARLVSLESFIRELQNLKEASPIILGDALRHYGMEATLAQMNITFINTVPHVKNMLPLLDQKQKWVTWEKILPFYLRPSAAEENASKNITKS